MKPLLEIRHSLELRDLDLANAGEWPPPAQWLALAALFASVFAASWLLLCEDKRGALAATRDAGTELRSAQRRKAAQSAVLETLKAQRVALDAALHELLRTLPTDTQVPGLLEDIARAAVSNDLAVEGIALEAEQALESHIELPIRLTVAGGYHQLGAFAAAVGTLERVVTLHDFELVPAQASPALRFAVLAKTYRYPGALPQ